MALPLCVRIDADDIRSAENLKNDGWREIEVLETWRKKIDSGENNFIDPTVRQATAGDANACQKIAQAVFTFDRLHADPIVSELDARRQKARWVEAAFADPSRILVSDIGCIRGFCIFQTSHASLRVDFLAVDTDWQGKGVAKILLKSGPTWFWSADWYEAGTQSTNLRARKLYASLGFVVRRRQRTFHK